jgi:hypothetical protein
MSKVFGIGRSGFQIGHETREKRPELALDLLNRQSWSGGGHMTFY